MIKLTFHHKLECLPNISENILPVQLYGLGDRKRGISYVGNPILESIRRLGIKLSDTVMDLMTIAMAVTAADTFVLRKNSANGWTRQLYIDLPLCAPEIWKIHQTKLENLLHFLSGDLWKFNFLSKGLSPQEPYQSRNKIEKLRIENCNCVSLFSGGLDSAIGAIDLLNQNYIPLLVSHAYKGDAKHQQMILQHYINNGFEGKFSSFGLNADPHLGFGSGETEISMRTRSFNFITFAVVAAHALHKNSKINNFDIFIPENGFISLNVPLTPRRIGTLSTRTTHPYFIHNLQQLFYDVGIFFNLKNPYQFKTKGQMVQECFERGILKDIVKYTVSCSHWKRKNKQCGFCIPCIIRRAALHAGKISSDSEYIHEDLAGILNHKDKRDDLLALMQAIHIKNNNPIQNLIFSHGLLPEKYFPDFERVYMNGLTEVENFLRYKYIL
ncbi:Qat anti-phage system QueC-like protein QatC [Snodgrassella alvi]|uniref:DNA-binding protein n=1 Tax=Snodgrassella alvi TaxID=1196083 RepID=A0A2N9X9P2_9NEIS|nr:Qat anti-phage system QueC-like protein QatC [Snodgrassella alvi]PIT41564.1 DNA-binding protein [Snodgrassella alvi]